MDPEENRRRLAAVAIGGAVGASLRWAIVSAGDLGTFPWPVLALNVVGSFLLGVVLAGQWGHPGRSLLLRDGLAVGFCGGLTTFSTFAVEVVQLARDGQVDVAATYVAASLVGTIGGVLLGTASRHRGRALTLPTEGSS